MARAVLVLSVNILVLTADLASMLRSQTTTRGPASLRPTMLPSPGAALQIPRQLKLLNIPKHTGTQWPTVPTLTGPAEPAA